MLPKPPPANSAPAVGDTFGSRPYRRWLPGSAVIAVFPGAVAEIKINRAPDLLALVGERLKRPAETGRQETRPRSRAAAPAWRRRRARRDGPARAIPATDDQKGLRSRSAQRPSTARWPRAGAPAGGPRFGRCPPPASGRTTPCCTSVAETTRWRTPSSDTSKSSGARSRTGLPLPSTTVTSTTTPVVIVLD